MCQLIVYSRATGRVRRVIDTGGQPVADARAHANVRPGEAFAVRTKRGKRRDNLAAWQAAASAACGRIPQPLHPDIEAQVVAAAPLAVRQPSDLHHVVDAQGRVVGSIHADPACGDAIPGHTLVRLT